MGVIFISENKQKLNVIAIILESKIDLSYVPNEWVPSRRVPCIR